MIQIAIDGPSGAGKSTLAKAIAARLGYIYVDTGAMYRAIGLHMSRCGIDPHDADAVTPELDNIKVDIVYKDAEQRVLLCGEDVSSLIRTPEISMYASAVSAIPSVRAFLLDLQRDIANRNNVIMDGRDIGTVILPNASVKIFLTASDEVRARRRYDELTAKGQSVSLEDIYNDMVKRDRNDKTRSIAPAVPADDAVILDNSDIDFEGTVARAIEIINGKI